MIDILKELKKMNSIKGIDKKELLKLLKNGYSNNYTVKQEIQGAILIYNSTAGENLLLNCIKKELTDINKEDYSCLPNSNCSSCYIKYLNKR